MRRLLASCAALLLAAAADPAAAQVAGQFGGATPVAVNAHVLGGYASFAHRQFEGLAQLRLSFYPGIDFGFQGGLHHFDQDGETRNAIELGADVRTIVARRGESSPVDLSLGGAISVSSADRYDLFGIGPTLAASRAHAGRGVSGWTPYAGAALIYWRRDLGTSSATGISLPLRVGLEYRPSADVRIELEFQVPSNDPSGTHPKLVLGANFPF